MRWSLSIIKNLPRNPNHAVLARRAGQATFSHLSRRAFAQVRDDHDRSLSDGSFASNTHLESTSLQKHPDDIKPVDERTLKLGKTLQILHDTLPKLLATPLPQEILSPSISLHLFPSTHPHLPTVSGRLAYNAALWTAPVAWGRVPVVGNVRLTILSERLIKHTSYHQGYGQSSGPGEKLIVRWRTCRGRGLPFLNRGIYGDASTTNRADHMNTLLGSPASPSSSSRTNGDETEEFEGLFLFEFDEKGRILRHTIEHVHESGNWERRLSVVRMTDWLLGLARGRGEREPELALGCCRNEEKSVSERVKEAQEAKRRRESED